MVNYIGSDGRAPAKGGPVKSSSILYKYYINLKAVDTIGNNSK